MADTYSQIYIQVVFSVQNRKALIHESWEDELYKYITGIIQNKGQKLIAINSFINEKQFTQIPFYWQEGFGAFSYSFSHIDKVVQYIKNQKTHHQKKTFKEEYLEFLEKFGIEYKDDYLFEWLD